MSTKPPEVRASGFYWILVPEGTAVVARWIDVTRSWLLTGWDGFLEDGEVKVLGDKLEPPAR